MGGERDPAAPSVFLEGHQKLVAVARIVQQIRAEGEFLIEVPEP
jgi:hypothetical protein